MQVKDLDSGLLDFPCSLEDQVVLLCWRMGEPSIEHWHTVEAGFKGRQPVDERFRRRSASGGSGSGSSGSGSSSSGSGGSDSGGTGSGSSGSRPN